MITPKEAVAAALGRAKAELEQALTDLEALPAFDPSVVGFATHALNNYLVVAEFTLTMLSGTLASNTDEQVHHWIENLQQVTRLMMHTTSQLMNASVSSGPRLVFNRVDFVQGTRRACDYYQHVANRKQIRILFEPEADIPPVRTDRVATGAVLDNLLSNAVKYSEPGKRIWVRLKCENDFVLCSVQDEGPGLSLDDQAKLFQKGVRLSAMPTGGESSTGYGLAVAKELVGLLGGTIWCESQPGQGACFAFRLPVWREGDVPG